ncbi:RICIN domain-containing protein [Streptomyces sp. BPTC-684]|uniref:RICIN domain-containing protein n=1 Tax=Streptomyces sp. BPTC-684 TaxID=3043734 RepID=UPI0024B04942|nr:RICIN domain-containing protein [Streptomyces sp. BPTC-684]WHM40948.1 RICIN domain-containing protein [Streptomyces sp. BPTC-684]
MPSTRAAAAAVLALSAALLAWPADAAPQDEPEVSGPYQVRALHSEKCLDVQGGPGATADGANVYQWTCLGPANTNQQWYLHASEGDSFFFTAAHSGKCLDVEGGPGATDNGDNVHQWTCHNPPRSNQRWFLQEAGDGYAYQIQAAHSGKCLDVEGGPGATADGTNVYQWTCLGPANTNQWWYLAPIEPTTSKSLAGKRP